jgi:hypothetical protein
MSLTGIDAVVYGVANYKFPVGHGT